MRIQEVYPPSMVTELLRLHKADPQWLRVHVDEPDYRVEPTQRTWLSRTCRRGCDWLGMRAVGALAAEGMKLFVPTPAQEAALAEIEVKLPYKDFAQPYPAMLVKLSGKFKHVLLHATPELLIAQLSTEDHWDDICTLVGHRSAFIEDALCRFDEECAVHAPEATRALRIALNSALALVEFGCTARQLFDSRDLHLAREENREGRRARRRLWLSTTVLTVSQDIKLHASLGEGSGEPTGAEVSPHWRRAHWAMQPHGPGSSLRKRILRPRVFVRKDLFAGELSDTEAVYRG